MWTPIKSIVAKKKENTCYTTVTINIKHIIAIEDHKDETIISTLGNMRFVAVDSYEEVLGKINGTK